MSSLYPFRVVRAGIDGIPSTIVGIQRTEAEARSLADHRTQVTTVEHYVLDGRGRHVYTAAAYARAQL